MADTEIRTKFTVDARDATEALNRLSKRAKDTKVEFDSLGNATVSFTSTLRVAKNQFEAQADLIDKNVASNRAYRESLVQMINQTRRATNETKKNTQAQANNVRVLNIFSKGLSGATVRTKSFTDALNKLRLAGFYLDKVFRLLATGVEEAIKYTENFNLATVSFGKNAKEMMTFVNDFSSAFMLNSADVTRVTGLFYQISHSMGLSSEQAKTLSKNWTKLAYDISSFYNISFEEAFVKLQAGLVGETEPLRRVGIVLTENNLALTAQNLGIEKSIRNMTEAEKIQLRYMTALDQTTQAQGDFARTFTQTANQLRVAREQLGVFLREVGTALLPIVEKAALSMSVFASAIASVIHRFNEANGLAHNIENVNTDTSNYQNTLEDAVDTNDLLNESLQATVKNTNKILNNFLNIMSTVRKITNDATLGIDELNILNDQTANDGGFYNGFTPIDIEKIKESINDLLDLELPDYDNVIGDDLSEYHERVQGLVDVITEFADDISVAIAPAVEAFETFRKALTDSTDGMDFFQLTTNVVTVLSQVVAGFMDALTAIYEFMVGVVEGVAGTKLPELAGIKRNEDGSLAITNDTIRTVTKYITEIAFGMKAFGAIADIAGNVKAMAGNLLTIAGWKVVAGALAVGVTYWGIKKGIEALSNRNEQNALREYGETGVLDIPRLSTLLNGAPSENFNEVLGLINEERARLQETGERSGSITIGEGDKQQVYDVLNPDYLNESLAAYNEFYPRWSMERDRNAYLSATEDWEANSGWLNRALGIGQPQLPDYTSQILSLEDFRRDVFDTEEFQSAWQPYNSVEPLGRRTTADESADNFALANKVLGFMEDYYNLDERSLSDMVVGGSSGGTTTTQPVELSVPEVTVVNDQPVIVESNTSTEQAPVEVSAPASQTAYPVTPPRIPYGMYGFLKTLNNSDGGYNENSPVDLTRWYGNSSGDGEPSKAVAIANVMTEVNRSIGEFAREVKQYSKNLTAGSPFDYIPYYDTAEDLDPKDIEKAVEEGSEKGSENGSKDGSKDGTKEGIKSINFDWMGTAVNILQSIANGLTSMLDAYVGSGLLYKDENGQYQSNIGNVTDKGTQDDIADDFLGSFAGFLPEQIATWYNAGLAFAEALNSGLLTAFVKDLPKILDWVITYVQEATIAFAQTMPELLECLANPELWTNLLGAIFEAIAAAIEMLPQIVEMAAMIVMQITNGIIENLPRIIEAFANPEFWNQILMTLVNLALYIVDNIDLIIQSLLTGIPALVSAIIEAIFSINWLAVGWNIVVKITEGIINAAIMLVETIINTITATISLLWTWLGIPAIPAIHLPRVDFSSYTMPLYAQGGFPEQGQLFIAREAGAEMVGSLGGKTAVANNDQIVEGIRAGVYDAVVDAMNQSNEGSRAINVYLDGKKIYQNQRRVARRTGLGFGMEGV